MPPDAGTLMELTTPTFDFHPSDALASLCLQEIINQCTGIALVEQSYTKPSKIIDYNKAFRLGCGRHTMSKFGLCRVPTSGWFISNKGLQIPSVYRNGRGMNLTSQQFVRSSHKILSYRFAPHLSLHYLSTQRPITNTIELRNWEAQNANAILLQESVLPHVGTRSESFFPLT